MRALTVQADCWGPNAGQNWLHLLAVSLLVPLFNVFAGLTVVHSYMAVTGQTTYEVVKGAKVGSTQ